jgi:hypothetical protein
MKEMNWFGSGFLGVLAANNILVFGLALAEIYAKLLASNRAMMRAWHVQNQPDRAFTTL